MNSASIDKEINIIKSHPRYSSLITKTRDACTQAELDTYLIKIRRLEAMKDALNEPVRRPPRRSVNLYTQEKTTQNIPKAANISVVKQAPIRINVVVHRRPKGLTVKPKQPPQEVTNSKPAELTKSMEPTRELDEFDEPDNVETITSESIVNSNEIQDDVPVLPKPVIKKRLRNMHPK